MHPTREQIAKFSAKLVGSLALSSIRRFRGLYPVLRAHGRGFARFHPGSTRPMENVTQPWKCKLLASRPPFPFVTPLRSREREREGFGKGFQEGI